MKQRQQQLLAVTAVAAVAGITAFLVLQSRKKKPSPEDTTPKRANRSVATAPTTATEADTIGEIIEALDKKGKALFKKQQFLEAAQVFTEALQKVQEHPRESSTLKRQKVTLLNNRSAMYEKAKQMELAQMDCDTILEIEPDHAKARPRKLRILEARELWSEAMVEICAIQILFMQKNKAQLRMGLPLPNPPVPQTKLQEVLQKVLPEYSEPFLTQMTKRNESKQFLPSEFTILQLLKSYRDFDEWMQPALDVSVPELTQQLEASPSVEAYLLRGLRYVYERKYEEASTDFETALKLAPENLELLFWTGMVRHWHYNLEGALESLKKAQARDGTNPIYLIQQAGVQLDMGNPQASLELFEQALKLDPNNSDVFSHRANLYSMQNQLDLAKEDLEMCLRKNPGYMSARLRLAGLLSGTDLDEARNMINTLSEKNAETCSYRGELEFAQGNLKEARSLLEKAIALEPRNPTPYVNLALVILNTPPIPGQLPDTATAIAHMEQAIGIDPQFTAAYVHLGQIKLGLAQSLDAARGVVDLYNQGLENARTGEEVRELCGMKVLAEAQVRAAESLNMETFSMN